MHRAELTRQPLGIRGGGIVKTSLSVSRLKRNTPCHHYREMCDWIVQVDRGESEESIDLGI